MQHSKVEYGDGASNMVTNGIYGGVGDFQSRGGLPLLPVVLILHRLVNGMSLGTLSRMQRLTTGTHLQ